MRELILMQGFSGSGKSFVADALKRDYMHRNIQCEICSTDEYWYQDDPTKYNFDPSKIWHAHKWNQDRVSSHMINNVPVIIVDNTNTRQTEANSYLILAQAHNYTIRVITVSCSLETAKKANATRPIDRQVPENVIEAQAARMEKIILDF